MQPNLTALDHLVLTVVDIPATVKFYQDVLGMQVNTFTPSEGSLRTSLKFGCQKINLHQRGSEFEPKAAHATPGSADLCFLTETPIAVWLKHLSDKSVDVIDGPIKRTGATGPILSIYIRDPDQNLIEISTLI